MLVWLDATANCIHSTGFCLVGFVPFPSKLLHFSKVWKVRSKVSLSVLKFLFIPWHLVKACLCNEGQTFDKCMYLGMFMSGFSCMMLWDSSKNFSWEMLSKLKMWHRNKLKKCLLSCRKTKQITLITVICSLDFLVSSICFHFLKHLF